MAKIRKSTYGALTDLSGVVRVGVGGTLESFLLQP